MILTFVYINQINFSGTYEANNTFVSLLEEEKTISFSFEIDLESKKTKCSLDTETGKMKCIIEQKGEAFFHKTMNLDGDNIFFINIEQPFKVNFKDCKNASNFIKFGLLSLILLISL